MAGIPHRIESPFLLMLGAQPEDWKDGHARISLPTRPDLLNRSGVVQGGVLATMLDHVCGLAGMYCTVPGNRRYGMTLSLTINYMGQAKAGRVVATGNVTSSGKKIFFAAAEARTQDFSRPRRASCATEREAKTPRESRQRARAIEADFASVIVGTRQQVSTFGRGAAVLEPNQVKDGRPARRRWDADGSNAIR